MNVFEDLTLATTAHNNPEMSLAMLRSFAENVGSPAEIVIVDDGSVPPMTKPDLVSPARLVRKENAVGFCKASDQALREVQTPYALLVDADVLFQPGDFAGGFDEFKKGNWAWVNFRQINFEGRPQASYEHPLMKPWLFAAGNQIASWWQDESAPQPRDRRHRIARVEVAHSSATMVKMDAFRVIGGFDPWYWQCQSDIDLSLRLRDAGFGVGVDLGYTVKHDGTGGKTGGTARVLDLYRSRVHLYERAFPLSRFYLRPLLFLRHLVEVIWFAAIAPFKRDERLGTRIAMLKGVLYGYR